MGEAIIVRADDVVVGPAGMFRVGGAETGQRLDFMVSEIPYAMGPPLHVHDAQDDTFFVLEGILTVQAGEEVIDLGPGDFVSVPPGVAHTFTNADKGQPLLRVVNVMTPGGFDGYFRDMMALDGPPDESTMAMIGRRHGVTWVGPPLAVRLGLQTT